MQVKQKEKEVKKFTGTKEGGIGDSSMYFVMRQSQGGVFQVSKFEKKILKKFYSGDCSRGLVQFQARYQASNTDA